MITPGQFFGTLQDAITIQWRNHLQTTKYSVHMALDEFYKEMPEKVDALIEAWQSNNGIIEDYANALMGTSNDPITYLEELRTFILQNKKVVVTDIGDTNFESLLDDVLALIDSTRYKLKVLRESKMISLVDYIRENLTSISKNNIKVYVIPCGKLTKSGKTKFNFNLWEDQKDSFIFATKMGILFGKENSLEVGDTIDVYDNDSHRKLASTSGRKIEFICPCNKNEYLKSFNKYFPKGLPRGLQAWDIGQVYSIKGIE